MAPTFFTIAEAGRALRSGQLSATELTKHCLERIRRFDGPLHSFVTVTEKQALRAAALVDEEIARDSYRGPLHGIPLALKDVIDVRGVRTTACSKLLLQNVPKTDSTVWRKLESAGAILLGKLTTHEFAVGGPCYDLPFPPARNPWRSGYFTGGSSSGSGVAVAAGLTFGALGTDSGGSIRTPAAHCGLVGLKPTYGLVSRNGVLPIAPSLDTVGPMTWTVQDNAILLNAIMSGEPGDTTVRPFPSFDATSRIGRPLKDLRIGYADEYDKAAGVVPEVSEAVSGVLRSLESQGARIDRISLPSLEEMTDCARIILMAESFAVHERTLRARPQDYGGIVRGRLMLAGFVSAADYVSAIKLRRELAVRMAQATVDCDLIITAGTAAPAPHSDKVAKFALMGPPPLVFPFNLTGAPALTMCCGFSKHGLPLSVQMASKPYDEPTLYSAANAYEQVTNWRNVRPPLEELASKPEARTDFTGKIHG